MSVDFGGVLAVNAADLSIEPGQLAGLIGPNGAGKSTFIEAVTGMVPIAGGEVHFDGRRIDALSASARANLGISRTFQSPKLFADLTVRENLLVASDRPRWWGALADLVKPSRMNPGMASHVDRVLDLLDIGQVANDRPSELSLSQQKLVGVGRALAASPRLVLLDEPAAGLDSGESRDLARRLSGIAAEGIAILLIDHDMSLVLEVCDPIYVLDFGSIIARGAPAEIRRDARVVVAYLGERARRAEDLEVHSGEVPETSPTPSDSTVTEGTASRSHARPTSSTAPLLELRDFSGGYDGLEVVRQLNLHVEPGEIVALIGPNGAGKTTTLLSISGLLAPVSGEIRVLGESPNVKRPWLVARRGVAHVADDRALFPGLTVAENLRLALPRGSRDTSLAFKHFPALSRLSNRKAGLLSGGEQQMLALGRALLGEPRLILVDEMSAGLAPIIVQQMLPVLRRHADETGAGVILVEQHTDLALEIADRAYVLVHGDLVEEGDAAELLGRIDILEAKYFGEVAIAGRDDER